MEDFDVIVVGGGPAGLTAAIELSNDYSVLITERGKLPQEKVCGGLLNEESIQFVQEWQDLKNILTTPHKVKLGYLDFDNEIVIETDRILWNINRTYLSRLQIDKLSECTIMMPYTKFQGFDPYRSVVTLLKKNGDTKRIKTNYIIGADGAKSYVRKIISNNPIETRLLLQVNVRGFNDLKNIVWFVYDEKVTDHYSWIIPKGDKAIVGTSVYKPENSSIEYLLSKLEDFFQVELKIDSKQGSYVNCIKNPHDLIFGVDNILLAGEAAGFISPSSFEGISYALQTGKAAARAIKNESNDIIEMYKETCKSVCERLFLQLKKAKCIYNKETRKEYFRDGLYE